MLLKFIALATLLNPLTPTLLDTKLCKTEYLTNSAWVQESNNTYSLSGSFEVNINQNYVLIIEGNGIKNKVVNASNLIVNNGGVDIQAVPVINDNKISYTFMTNAIKEKYSISWLKLSVNNWSISKFTSTRLNPVNLENQVLKVGYGSYRLMLNDTIGYKTYRNLFGFNLKNENAELISIKVTYKKCGAWSWWGCNNATQETRTLTKTRNENVLGYSFPVLGSPTELSSRINDLNTNIMKGGTYSVVETDTTKNVLTSLIAYDNYFLMWENLTYDEMVIEATQKIGTETIVYDECVQMGDEEPPMQNDFLKQLEDFWNKITNLNGGDLKQLALRVLLVIVGCVGALLLIISLIFALIKFITIGIPKMILSKIWDFVFVSKKRKGKRW